MNHVLLSTILLLLSGNLFSQQVLTGNVLDEKTGLAIEQAVVSLPELDATTYTDHEGFFKLNIPVAEKYTLTIHCLGYVDYTVEINKKQTGWLKQTFHLKQDNLKLNEVVVTAQKKQNETSSYTIDRKTINHLQANSISDIMAQLPGGTTNKALSLTSGQRIALRSQSATELDNASFATAVELDGVRLSNNGNFTSGVTGTDIRNISMASVESIEIITGLPSVESGDLSSGLVKITTKKGKSPLEVETTMKPLIKSVSAQKGFQLGKDAGILNVSFEHTSSMSDRASPYTTYKRNGLNLSYNHNLGRKEKPLYVSYNLSGNAGGYNSESDPDAFTGTYNKTKDVALRTGLRVSKTLNYRWISNLEFFGSLNYTDQNRETRSRNSSSSAVPVALTTEEGYHMGETYSNNPSAAILMIPAGYWYTTALNDEKPMNYGLQIKARLNRLEGHWSNNLLLGLDYNASGNLGQGESVQDKQYPYSFRPFDYSKQPWIYNYALFLEDKMSFPLFSHKLYLQAGVRSDITSVHHSEYGTVSAFSPRLNLRYGIIERRKGFITDMTITAATGDAVKLPSAGILYPRPAYSDKLAFASGTLNDNSGVYAFYTKPARTAYNPDLKWQRNRKSEIGIELRSTVAELSVTGFCDRTSNPFNYTSIYAPFDFKLTDITKQADIPIAYENRVFSIDKNTGIVSVLDKNNPGVKQELSYATRRIFQSSTMYTNGSPVHKWGIDWILTFKRIETLRTSIRLDGSYFSYYGADETIKPDLASVNNMSDGTPYKYIGWYAGGATSANGSESKKLSVNTTFTTHIPQVRMIFTLRIETSLYDYTRNLSTYSKGARSFVLDSKENYMPSTSKTDIYAGDVYVGTYPLYYSTNDDMNARIPFAEKFYRAKENDPALYNELAKMVLKTNYSYYFNKTGYSPYASANINLTKEIGDNITVSFMANNFFNNTNQIKNSGTGNKLSLYKSGKIPSLYYGISLRIKL